LPSTPPEIKSGLLDMETRSRAPRPRKPKLEIAVPPPPPPILVPAVDTTPMDAPATEDAAPAAAPQRLRAPARPTVRGVQIYLDGEADQVLRACREAGEVSNSAVIRLALAELAARRTPEEIVRILLFGDNPAHRAPGRKRGA